MKRQIGIALLIGLVVAACNSGTPTPEDEASVPIESAETPVEEVDTDDLWSRIQEAGVLKVGTSADYRPFEYYNEELVVDGFDPALIKAIGELLGVQVEISDFAFEGLGQALQIGQIDAAIAAISVTEARLAEFDFSDVYWTGTGAALVKEDSAIQTFESTVDAAGLRVGAQKFTVYESWAADNLVDTGLISGEMLLSYAKPEDAVNDLKADRVDTVLLDQRVALDYVLEGGVRIAADGFSPQVYAIGLPKGAEELQSRINQALIDLRNSGHLDELANEYLGVSLDESIVPPELTPAPVPPPTACTNGMAYVADLNLVGARRSTTIS